MYIYRDEEIHKDINVIANKNIIIDIYTKINGDIHKGIHIETEV